MQASDLIGPFRLPTRSKDVRLKGVSGDVRLENENGAVEIHMTKLGNVQLSNRNSDVQTLSSRQGQLSSWMPTLAAAKSNQTSTL